MPKFKYRITIIGLHYSPETSGNAPYTSRLAERLSAAGHEVRVQTGYPHYPEWKLAAGYTGWQRAEVINGVPVKRLRHFIPTRVTSLGRLHMELSFGLRLLFSKWEKTDVIIVVSPALFSSAFVVLRARLGIRRPSVGIWIQDLYSRGLEETGVGTSWSARMMKFIEGAIIRSATKVAVIHQRFADYLVDSFGVPESNISVIRNWTHVASGSSLDRGAIRRKFGWLDEDIVVLHAGNMGMKQGLRNTIEAAKLAEETGSKVRFVLLGDGNQRQSLEKDSAGLKRLQILPSVADDDFIPTLRSADILLVNEMAGLREMSVPSKLTSYFASGQPVIAATESDSTTANEIALSKAGLRVPPDSPQDLLEAAEDLGSDTVLSAKLGNAGVRFAELNLSEAAALAHYESWLTQMAPTGSAQRC